eukprot:jgi/Bigna1/144691/aug1.90_g19399
MVTVDLSSCIIIASPWLRCMQTSLPFAKASKLELHLDPAVGEGAEFCTHDAPPHEKEEPFKGLVDTSYKPLLEGKAPKTDMTNVAEALENRFGFEEGRTIVIFSHADPCIYLAAALAKMKPNAMNCTSPTAMFTLEQEKKGEVYRVRRINEKKKKNECMRPTRSYGMQESTT